MSEPSRSPSPVELEPVTCWPLILGAVGFVSLAILTAGAFAAWTAFFPPPRPAVAVETTPDRESPPVRKKGIGLPAPPVVQPEERVVKVKREVIGLYRPMPPARRESAERTPPPPPAARAAVQAPGQSQPAKVVPTYLKPPQRAEEELLRQLWKDSSEIDLETQKGAGKRMFEEGKRQLELRRQAEQKRRAGPSPEEPPLTKVIQGLLKSRGDLRGLPLRDEKACQSSEEDAKVLGAVSTQVRLLQSRADRSRARSRPGDLSFSADIERASLLGEYLAEFRSKSPSSKDARRSPAVLARHKKRAAFVRPLEQMFQTESALVRAALIETLAGIDGKEATRALARRAAFDLSPAVRSKAVETLRKRSASDARPVFVSALQHPWPPVADHAALALAQLNDREAVGALEKMLDRPDPRAPQKEGGKWFVREVVRVNHLRNCLLCHPPADRSCVVQGPIPTPGKALPVVYYAQRSITGNSVRADIVYFRQDFSVMHEVENPDKWPTVQRFDYLVRKRELTAVEIAKLPGAAQGKAGAKTTYPQREAVQYALHKLAAAKAKELSR
jgi:hypothetical protein